MDREKVIKERLGYLVDFGNEKKLYTVAEIAQDALAMLKEQESTINELQNAYSYLQKQFFEAQDKLLKEQEAVEPTLIREGRNKNYNDYVCPRCDNEVVYEQNYCSECGVRFLWEGR